MKNIFLFTFFFLFASKVFATVAPIGGVPSTCVGSSFSLFDATPGGVWESANPGVALPGPTGITGLSVGTTVISYRVGGESVTIEVTVNPAPTPITGPATLCTGVYDTMHHATPGGRWSISGGSLIDSITGSIVLIPAATFTVTYTLPGGCKVTKPITGLQSPNNITGGGSVCVGGSPIFNNSVAGGTWSSSDVSVMSIVSTTGVATNLSVGSATITYTLPSGCYKTVDRTINPASAPITGASTVCAGNSITLSDATTGGYWSTSDTSVATVSSSGGVVTGIAAGTATITYNAYPLCSVYMTVTVTGLPAISGIGNVCTTYTTSLTNSVTGGTWSSSNTAVATVTSSGLVTGVTAGTSVITYAFGCGYVTKTVNVSAVISPITGTASVCAGSVTALSDATTGGTWSTSDASIATVAGGLVTGASAGTATITYTTGTCAPTTKNVTVNVAPTAITGSSVFCLGLTTTLSSTPAGGTWISSNTSIAVVGPASGVVIGTSAGTTSITYSLATGCYVSTVITVSPTPTPIIGDTTVCAGSTITLSNLTPGGTWSASSPAIAITAAGVVTGVSVGTGVVSYTYFGACSALRTVNVISTCSGTPVGGTAVATGGAPGGMATLSLSGATVACGISYQWQSSPDNVTWTNISGATLSTYATSASSTLYYRCMLTCASSGLSSNSTSVIACGISSHAVVADTFCNITHIRTVTIGASSAYSLSVQYGDGSSGSYPASTGSVIDCYHAYAMSGSYTVKEVLYYGSAAVDSVSFTYTYMACQSLPIRLFEDVNTNCAMDAGDFLNTLPVTVNVDSAGVAVDTISTTSGFYYSAYGPAGTIYKFSVIDFSGDRVVSCPSTGMLTDTLVSAGGPYGVKQFGFSCSATSGGAYDLSCHAAANTGRHSQIITLTVHNDYCEPASPTVKIVYSPKYNFAPTNYWCAFTSPMPTTVSGNVLTWNMAPIAAHSSQVISLHIETIIPTPWLIVGDTVRSYIIVTPTTGDVDTSNNVIVRIDTVKSSFDPNVIDVSPKGAVLPCTQLEYAVQFENDGNDTAHNIYILDTLSASLDPATIEPVTASSAMFTNLVHSGPYTIARFDFPAINLPDSSHHSLCDGMVIFRIKTRAGVADGTSIPNQVGIYFDDNPVVMTNSIANTIGINPIAGPGSVCVGDTVVLTDATPTGTWSASGAFVSLLGSSTVSRVIGTTAGTTTVSYQVSNACTSRTATHLVNVNTVPDAGTVTGADTICQMATTIFADGSAGGTWISSSSVATVNTSGLVQGVLPGSALISYALANSCGSSTATKSIYVDSIYTPSVTAITAVPGVYVSAGTSVTFTSSVWGAGPAPSYQWYLNGTAIAGATAATYTTALLADHDSVSCSVTGTVPCGNVTSNHTIMHVATGIGAAAMNEISAVIVPNPNKGTFVVRATLAESEGEILIANISGQVIARYNVTAPGNKLEKEISQASLPSGTYLLSIRTREGHVTLPLLIEW